MSDAIDVAKWLQFLLWIGPVLVPVQQLFRRRRIGRRKFRRRGRFEL